ncbi:MAG: hypothetical protein J6X60_07700, partial [Ruminiclostridium sp.]|nr:hypothetical protein [Ruminiclostridium sp.]
NRSGKTIAAFILGTALIAASGCAQPNTPAAGTTTEKTTAAAASASPESTAADTSASEAATAVTSETTAASESFPETSDLFTLEDYGWVMNDVPDSLTDMDADPSRRMAFILHTDFTQLGDDSEVVFYSLDAENMIYGEYIVDLRAAADPELETLKSEPGQDIVAVPVMLRDIIDKNSLDISKIAQFYVTKNYNAIKLITTAQYDPGDYEGPTAFKGDPAYDSDPEKHPFRLGVWLVKDEEGSEYYDETYHYFSEGGVGSFMSQSAGIGMGFNYEAADDTKLRYRFEVGVVGEFSYLEIVDGDPDEDHFKAKRDGSDGIQDWTYLCPTDEFSFYDNRSIGEMARFIYGMGQYSIADPIVETGYELGMISVVIRDPSVEDYTRSILEWYDIDRYTGKGYNVMTGDPVDLTVLEGNWAEMPYPNTFTLMPAIKELDTLRENGDMLGFWYIGYVEPDMDSFYNFRDLYLRMFEITGMDRKVRYLNSFPSDSFVTSGSGQELYLLLPSDIHGSVTISELLYDEASGRTLEVRELYRQDDNLRPILLKCNRSEIMPDVLVRITDSKGGLLEWSPCISGENGKVVTANDTNKTIRDFTDYNSLIHPDNMPDAMG